MKKLFVAFSLTLLTLSGFSQTIGLGIRAGNFNALSIKKYSGKHALEFNIGRIHMYSGKSFYNNRFNSWYIDQQFEYDDYQYTNYRGTVPLGIGLNYLIRKPIGSVLDENTDGLEWYVGFGGQMRFQKYRYNYQYKIKGDPNWHHAEARVNNIDLGPDGTLGLEYTFKEIPVSVFMDATLFVEIVDNPFLFWPQGCVGVRYNFAGGKGSSL
jgi:hypothetical protein